MSAACSARSFLRGAPAFMAQHDGEYFGSAEQRALLQRGRAMFRLLGQDPRFAYYGRTVVLASSDTGSVEMLAALAALQGNSNCAILSDADLPIWRAEAEARGLVPVHYARWSGGDAAMQVARKIVDDHALPDDLTILRIGPETPDEALAQLAEVALACGVLPPAGAALRGLDQPGLALLAVDDRGRGVSCAAAVSFFHRDHPLAQQCWWGMLATVPDRRGQRLALDPRGHGHAGGTRPARLHRGVHWGRTRQRALRSRMRAAGVAARDVQRAWRCRSRPSAGWPDDEIVTSCALVFSDRIADKPLAASHARGWGTAPHPDPVVFSIAARMAKTGTAGFP
jgi:hypothetical protein